jgi:hypothetical protein
MSDEENSGQETEVTTTKTTKVPTPSVKVTMSDGREVEFVGKRRMLKDYTVTPDGVDARFDFVNGETRKIHVGPGDALLMQFAGHGLLQKVGDEAAGADSIEDVVMAIDKVLERLSKGEWGTTRAPGDSFSGAGIVVRAIMEATGKPIDFVKAFLEKKLEAGKESGLTRQKLYASFKAPGTRTAPIIERLEKEKLAGKAAVDADAELDAMVNA